MGARIWRAIAMMLFIVLVWQASNAALSPPPAPPVVDGEAHAPILAAQQPAMAPAMEMGMLEPPPRPTLRVTNTGGDGVYLRATPRMEDRVRVWPDDTIMEPTGIEIEADGRRWTEVRDPAGTIGWIPSEYLT